MRHFITIAFCLLSVTLFGQLNDADAFFNGSYDKAFVHKHKIKQINVTTYIDSSKTSFAVFEFDNWGFLRKQTIFDKSMKKVNDFTFSYNKQGGQTERTNFAYDLNKTYTVTFNKTYEGSLLIQETSSELPFLTTYFYSDSGRKIQSNTFLSRDTTISPKRVSIYSYDTKGKLKSILETFTESSNSTPVSIGTTEYIYDEKENISVVLREGKANYILSYDKDSFLKSKTVKMPDDLGGLTILDKYSYVFWK